MTTILTTTTTERILRTLGLTALFGVFSGWFLYDAYVGYPRHNLEKMIESLNPVPQSLPAVDERITADAFNAWVTTVGDLKKARLTRKDIVDKLGPPGWENPAKDEMRYFGRGGSVRVLLAGDLVKDGGFDVAEHNDVDLAWQKILGFMLLPVGVGMVFQLVRVLTTRVELSDAGLKVRGRPTIPFEAMTGIDISRYAKKGFVDLSYSQDGAAKKVRLDDYVIREFKPIIEEISRRQGFDIVLPTSRSDEADEDEQSAEVTDHS